MPRPRLAVLSSTFPRDESDATPGFVFELCARLSRHFEVTVIAPNCAGARSGDWNGIRVLRYRYAPRSLEQLTEEGGMLASIRSARWRVLLVPLLLLGQWWALWRSRAQFDLVHAHWLFPQGLIAVLACGRRPVVCTSHGADVLALHGRFWDQVRIWVARRSRLLTAVGAPLQHALREIAGNTPVHCLPMGVDIRSRFLPAEHPEITPGQLLFVGRLVPKKGVDVLLRALAVLAGERPGLQLSIVGEGPEWGRLHQLATQLGVRDRVLFLGALPNHRLPEHYRRADIVVLPFRTAADGESEGLGLTLVEALACGCRVVSSEVEAQRTALGEMEGWWRVPPAQPTLLAASIALALTSPGDPRILRAIREPALQAFDWESVGQAYARVLSATLTPTGSRLG